MRVVDTLAAGASFSVEIWSPSQDPWCVDQLEFRTGYELVVDDVDGVDEFAGS